MKRTLSILLLLALSVGIGFGWDYLYGLYELRQYPLGQTEYVEMYSKEYSVPREVIYAVIKCESSFRIEAQSHAGAVGLMQITPDTFDWLKSKTGEKHENGMLYDPQVNIKYGVYFLSILYSEFNNWELAFAAYNAGLNRVKYDWLLNEEYIKDGKIIRLPFEETDQYVKKVINAMKIYRRLYKL